MKAAILRVLSSGKISFAAVFTLATAIFFSPESLNAEEETRKIRFVILDGVTTSYSGQDSEPNWQLLGDWIKTQFPLDENFIPGVTPLSDGYYPGGAEVDHIDLRRKEPIVSAAEIMLLHPDVVIFHWSSFGKSSDEPFCRPYSRDNWMDCSDRMLSLLQQIYERNKEIIFIGFSQAENLCYPNFKYAVRNRMAEKFAGDLFTSRTFAISMMRFVSSKIRRLSYVSFVKLEKSEEDYVLIDKWSRLVRAASIRNMKYFENDIGRPSVCRLEEDGENGN